MTVENCKANFLRAFEFFRPATLKKVMKGGDKWGDRVCDNSDRW